MPTTASTATTGDVKMTDFTRKAHVMIDNATGEAKDFKTVNKAKKESRRLQREGKTVSKG